ncbi:MAG: S-layer homology domain-containing protein [Anaerovoracaceae bacterium]|jgi:uncharacterized repeat protein (TIGR02543 family)
MVVALIPVTAVQASADTAVQASADTSDTSDDTGTQWDVSKSKTATALSDDGTSDITISIPSKEEALSSEICFVLDKSQFSATEESALELLSDLKTVVDNTDATVKVDIVGFNRRAINLGTYDLKEQYDEIKAAFEQSITGGTNMHAGLLEAQKVLASDTSIPDSRKYMILVSDGDTYLWCKNGDTSTPYSRAYNPDGSGPESYGGYYDEVYYAPSRISTDESTGETNVTRPTTSDQTLWDEYLEDVRARNEESNGDSYDFIWYYYDHLWMMKSQEAVVADGYIYQPRNFRSASNIDMAFLYAADTYYELASQYHCYAMAVPSWNTSDGGHEAFMDYLNNGASTGFESIENDVLYALGAGSTVTDYMGYDEEAGYNFDLTDPSAVTITVDDGSSTETLTAEKIDDNHYGFGKIETTDTSSQEYQYEITYYPDDMGAGEHFVWTTNVNVTNFEHVQIHYTVKFTDKSSDAGTHGQLDLDGDGIVDGTDTQVTDPVYTNQKAVLVPIDTSGNTSAEETFPMPSVSYYVEPVTSWYRLTYETNGGNEIASEVYEEGTRVDLSSKTPVRDGYTFTGWYSDSDLTTPITSVLMTSNKTVYAGWEESGDTTPDLDTVNHYAYVAGYEDGTVRPENNITREETAAIIFRLLKSTSREENLTYTNNFADVDDSRWSNTEISTLTKMGIIYGRSEDEFDPEAYITRAEFAALFARFSTADSQGTEGETPAFSDISGHWAEADINKAVSLGWIAGYPDGTFRPDEYITRAEAMTLINSVLMRVPSDESHILDGVTWSDNLDKTAWYYIAVQEATNSHDYTRENLTSPDEQWTEFTGTPDWEALEQKN